MTEYVRKNKLFIVVLGLMLIVSIIILKLIFINKNSAKVPLRGVFVNGTVIQARHARQGTVLCLGF